MAAKVPLLPRNLFSFFLSPINLFFFFQAVVYEDSTGKPRKSRLLLSGFWGVVRHANYVFELLLALAWSLPGASHGAAPFAYVVFLLVLLVHR